MKRRLNAFTGVCAAALIAAPAISFAGASHIFYKQLKTEQSQTSARADQVAPPQQVAESAQKPQS